MGLFLVDELIDQVVSDIQGPPHADVISRTFSN